MIDVDKKTKANEAASAFYSEQLNADLLKGISIDRSVNERNQPKDQWPSKPDNIGIWKKYGSDDTNFWYERDANLRLEWVYWADNHKIPPKNKTKRIVFLGESAARGFFYDPYYNPAIALESMLKTNGLEEAEVVDLAKTNMELDELVHITMKSFDLEPDAIVVFAGNNWYTTVKGTFKDVDYKFMADAIDKEQIGEFRDYVLKRYKQLISNYLKDVQKQMDIHKIPVIFVIPEFNLLDWKSSLNEKIPRNLLSEGIANWISLKEEGNKSLEKGDFNKLEKIGTQLIALDETNPFGYELLAYSQIEKDVAEARKNLEQARDMNIFSRCFSKPRIHNISRETILKISRESDIEVIDSSTLFSSRLNGKLPGRDFFLDYCHLTEEGIKVTMASVAQKLIEVLVNNKEDFNCFYNTDLKPSNRVKATAFINAAIHNAHYGQTHDVLEFLCTQGLKYSEKSKEYLLNYIDLATRVTSTMFCKSHEQLIEDEFTTQYGSTGIMQKRNQKNLDLNLVNAMVTSLKEQNIDIENSISELRLKEHQLTTKKNNLLKSFYSSDSYDIYPGKTPSYFQSRNYMSNFYVIAESRVAIEGRITFRTPFGIRNQGHVSMLFNDHLFLKTPVSEVWKNIRFRIKASWVVEGVNRIKINWPIPHKDIGDTENTNVSQVNEEDILTRFYIVFGEIFSFWVKKEENNINS